MILHCIPSTLTRSTNEWKISIFVSLLPFTFVFLNTKKPACVCVCGVWYLYVKCMDLPTNEGITKYEYCRLKVVKRNCVELSLKVSLLKLPITNLTTRLQVFQRSDGYRPFMYNVYFDFCKLMGSKRYEFTIERFVFNAISKHSNFNHSCPWKEVRISVITGKL